MSIFSAIGNGLSKATHFLLTVFTKTSDVNSTFVALAPATKAAILATFYDVAKTVATGAAAATAAAAGDIPAAFTLSETTLTLIKSVIADGNADVSVISADLKALGIK